MEPIEGGRRAKGAAGIGRSAGRELLGSAAVQGTTCRDWPQGWRQRRTRARWSWAMHWNHTWMQPTPYPREVESGPEWGIPPAVAAAWGMACRDWPQGQRQRRARTGWRVVRGGVLPPSVAAARRAGHAGSRETRCRGLGGRSDGSRPYMAAEASGNTVHWITEKRPSTGVIQTFIHRL